MSRAFVLVNSDLDSEAELQSELRLIKGVVEVYQVYGVYDMVVEVVAESDKELKEIIFSRIRTLRYMRSTITLTTVS